jgi:arylformamidase
MRDGPAEPARPPWSNIQEVAWEPRFGRQTGCRGAALSLLSGAATLTGALTLAQQAPAAVREKGPLVWLDMDQKELDDAYDQVKYDPNLPHTVKRCAVNSELVRTRLGAPKRLAYGTTPIEGIDLYATKATKAPINIFVHGGGWQRYSAKENAFPAELFVNAGAHYAVLDFINVDQAGGSLIPIVEQVRRAVAWIYKNAETFGGDPNRIYVSAHSAGAHLAAAMIATDWQKHFGLPTDIVKGAVLCSGMYDLKAVRLSARSSYVKFTDEMEEALSPQRHLDLINAPLTLVYGTLETPEFIRQTRDFASALQAAGKPVKLIVAESYHHWEAFETLANPYGVLGRAALEQMRLIPV